MARVSLLTTVFETMGRPWHRRYGDVRWHLADIWTLGYMGGLALILPFFHSRVENWQKPFFVHVVFVVLALELVRASQRYPRVPLLGLLRILYPGFVIVYGFLEIAGLQHMFTGSSWATPYMIEADLLFFGVHPTVWAKQFYHPVIDEVMAVFRVMYYPLGLFVLVPLLLKKRRDAALASAAIVIITYICNYFFFFLFPAVNPRMVPEVYQLDTTEYTGYWMAAAERLIQGDQGAVAGASFPSAHVSATIAWTVCAYLYLGRGVGHLFTVISIGTALGTVYLGYHHAVDPIGGVILCAVTCPLAIRALRRRGEEPAGARLRVPAAVSAPAPAAVTEGAVGS